MERVRSHKPKAWECRLMAEHLPSQFKAPGSTPSTVGEKRKRRKKKKGRERAMRARSPPHQTEHVFVVRVGRDEIWGSLARHSLLQQFLGLFE